VGEYHAHIYIQDWRYEHASWSEEKVFYQAEVKARQMLLEERRIEVQKITQGQASIRIQTWTHVCLYNACVLKEIDIEREFVLFCFQC
jgi:hypothetical protein